VVASDIPGVNEIVTDGHTGILFAGWDAEDLALAVERALSLTPVSREAMVYRAYVEYQRRFTAATMLENYLRVYTELLQS
jgi:glycosyltransferase involved in cell wall biosynthesis